MPVPVPDRSSRGQAAVSSSDLPGPTSGSKHLLREAKQAVDRADGSGTFGKCANQDQSGGNEKVAAQHANKLPKTKTKKTTPWAQNKHTLKQKIKGSAAAAKQGLEDLERQEGGSAFFSDYGDAPALGAAAAAKLKLKTPPCQMPVIPPPAGTGGRALGGGLRVAAVSMKAKAMKPFEEKTSKTKEKKSKPLVGSKAAVQPIVRKRDGKLQKKKGGETQPRTGVDLDGELGDSGAKNKMKATSRGNGPSLPDSLPRETYGANTIVVGVDEAGRGPLAGPVVCASVSLQMSPTQGGAVPEHIRGVTDSKKLSETQREQVYASLVRAAASFELLTLARDAGSKTSSCEAETLGSASEKLSQNFTENAEPGTGFVVAKPASDLTRLLLADDADDSAGTAVKTSATGGPASSASSTDKLFPTAMFSSTSSSRDDSGAYPQLHVRCVIVPAWRIDEVNILEATFDGMTTSVLQIQDDGLGENNNRMSGVGASGTKISKVLIDGPHVPSLWTDKRRGKSKSAKGGKAGKSGSKVGKGTNESKEAFASETNARKMKDGKMKMKKGAEPVHGETADGPPVLHGPPDAQSENLKAASKSSSASSSSSSATTNAAPAARTTEAPSHQSANNNPGAQEAQAGALSFTPPPFEVVPVIKGDGKEWLIAAASIVAKVVRDRYCVRFMEKRFPAYGFEKHKGYGVKAHMEALKKQGACAEHRFSFEPVKRVFEKSMATKKLLGKLGAGCGAGGNGANDSAAELQAGYEADKEGIAAGGGGAAEGSGSAGELVESKTGRGKSAATKKEGKGAAVGEQGGSKTKKRGRPAKRGSIADDESFPDGMQGGARKKQK